MRRNIGEVFVFFLAAFGLLAGYITYIQVWRGPYLSTHPRNPRVLEAEMSIKRGGIVGRNGEILARTVYSRKGPDRAYPGPRSLAHVIGYNHELYGRTGLEMAFNRTLLGLEDDIGLSEIKQEILGTRKKGNSLILTIDPRLQREAEDALGRRTGAVVALDPFTGGILASVSSPGFDPNKLDDTWHEVVRGEGSPLLDRVTHGLYPPGSAFKVLVLAAALDLGQADLDTEFTCEGYIDIDDHRISCPGNHPHGRINLTQAMAFSCNVTFVRLALLVGAKDLGEYARRFMFNENIPFDLTVSESRFPSPRRLDDFLLGEAAIGQGAVLVTPLLMAMMAGTIANGGRLMQPYVVWQIRSPDGRILRETRPREMSRPITEAVAGKVNAAMVAVTGWGTGVPASIPGVAVAGKTGTADNPHGKPHAWFIGFAPADRPRVALAVVVENGGAGGQVAAPIARRVIDLALRIKEVKP